MTRPISPFDAALYARRRRIRAAVHASLRDKNPSIRREGVKEVRDRVAAASVVLSEATTRAIDKEDA